jgi:imidazolonepropionase-like amidohydrolase
MYHRIALLVPVFLLCACRSPSQLTEGECRILVDKSNALALGHAAPDQIDATKQVIANGRDDAIDRCTSGKLYDREDYKCILKADTFPDAERCVDAAFFKTRGRR